MKIHIYIDGNNLYRAARSLDYTINYKKFRGWLRQKYNPYNVYLFLGYIPERKNFYDFLSEIGFTLIFKQTQNIRGIIKGNCDAELVLKAVSDYYVDPNIHFILISGDGDFSCLIEFLINNNRLHTIIAPNINNCSFLIRNKNCEIVFLNDHYHKFTD
jgi:uncharacterized LabA/DUF88 family protein